MPAKENSREWAWALQQNIMGLRFEHTQLILKHTQHGHLGIARENHMIFPQLIFIFNFLASSFAASTLLSLLLKKFLIHKRRRKKKKDCKQESGRDSHQSYSTFRFFTIRPTTSRLWLVTH